MLLFNRGKIYLRSSCRVMFSNTSTKSIYLSAAVPKLTCMSRFEIKCIESKINGPRDHYAKFLLEPLEKGQGAV
jgi:hypothetical protein